MSLGICNHCRELLKAYSKCENGAEIISVQNAWLSQQRSQLQKAIPDDGGIRSYLLRKCLFFIGQNLPLCTTEHISEMIGISPMSSSLRNAVVP